MVMTIADLFYKKPKEHTKKALDGSLELNERLLVSNIYYVNSNAEGWRFQ